MSRKRKREKNPLITLAKSAALEPEEAGLPARGCGPVGRPAWAPGDVDLFKVPEPVRQAVAEIIEPAYRQIVVEAEDPLERSIGLTLIHLMWLEVLDQHEAKHDYLETAVLELPEDRSDMIDRHLRMLNTKVKVGAFLARLREMRRCGEAAAQSQPALDAPCQMLEKGDNQVSVDRDQVSMTRSRGEDAEGECEKRESCHPKTGSWELEAGSCERAHAGKKLTAEEMKAATQNQVSVDRDQLSVTRSDGGLIARAHTDLRTPNSDLRLAHRASAALATSNQKLATSLPAIQNIEARFEQVRTQILAHAAFFVGQGAVEATWRTYRGRRLGPYFRVFCRQRRVRPTPCTGMAPQQTSIYLGRSPELAARVGELLDELRQHIRRKRRCEELRRQVRRGLARAKDGLRQVLAQHGVELKGFEFRGAARAFDRLPPMPK